MAPTTPVEIATGFIEFAKLILPGLLGFHFGLKTKRPCIMADSFFSSNQKTYFKIINVGESAAKNIKIDRISIKVSETFLRELFKEYPDKGGDVIFKFEEIDYLLPQNPKEVICKAELNDGTSSESARELLSDYLKAGREFRIQYKNIFDIPFDTKFILSKDKIQTS